MELDKLKLKRLCESKKLKGRIARTTKAAGGLKAAGKTKGVVRTTKRLTVDAKGNQIYAEQPGGAGAREATDDEDESHLDEGKKHDTPAFVRHCVTAITEKPADLERVEKDAPADTDGSPFAICWAKYKGDKRSLVAKHSRGEHHSVAQYEKSLATLREDVDRVRQQNASRTAHDVAEEITLTPTNRHLIRYTPRG